VIEQGTPLRQRREFAQIVDAALRTYRQNLPTLDGIAAVAIPLGIAYGIFQEAIKDKVVREVVVNALAAGQLAVGLLVVAATLSAIQDIANGVKPGFGRSYDAAFSRFPALAVAELRALFHVFLFAITVVGIPWAIQRFIRWIFVQQTVMLEGAQPKEALSRSAAVVEGSWWRTAGISLGLGLPAAAVTLGFLSFPFGPIAVSSTMSAAMGALVSPFVIVATTLLYFDLKTRKEEANASRDISTAVEETT
jgi:hypothetical protein